MGWARAALLGIGLALLACGDDAGGAPDASPATDARPTDSGAETDSGPPPAGNCDDYCTTVTSNCTGQDAQYASMAECLSYCSQIGWEPGVADVSQGGNTIGCRQYHAGAAATEPALHCAHAGPSGGDVCGSWCDVYCDNLSVNCTGDDAQYPDRAACESTCAELPATGSANDTSGDTVQCRVYHGGVPASGNSTFHCPHAGPDGAGVCI